MHRDPNIGNTAIAMADAARQAREDALDARDAQQLAEGRELLAAFPRVATPAMLRRLLDLGDAPQVTTDDLLRFLLLEYRCGNVIARMYLRKFWLTAQDYPELLPEPTERLPAERLRVTCSALDLEQLR